MKGRIRYLAAIGQIVDGQIDNISMALMFPLSKFWLSTCDKKENRSSFYSNPNSYYIVFFSMNASYQVIPFIVRKCPVFPIKKA